MKNKNISLKKVLSVFVAVLMLVSMVPSVMAADEVIIRNTEAAVLGGTLTVKGNLENAQKRDHIIAFVSKVGDDVSNLSTKEDYKKVLAMGYVSTSENNLNEFEVRVEIPDAVKSGTYKVTVGSSKAITPVSLDFYYFGYKDRETVLNTVNDENVTPSELVKVLDRVPEVFNASGASTAIYKSLGKNAKNRLAEFVIANRGSEEQTIVSFGEIAKEGILVASIAEAEADKNYAPGFKALNLYSDLAGFDVNDARYTRLSDAENIVKTVAAQGEINSASDIASSIDDALYLARLNETSYLAMPGFIKDNNDFFNVDEDELKDMTSVKKKSEYLSSALRSNTPVYTIAEFENAWEKSCNQAEKEYKKYLSSSSTGSSGSSSSKKDKPITTATINQGLVRNDPLDKKITVDEYYDDIAGYEWAWGAILDLTQNNIINGTGDKKFEPGRTLKREEFMKLLVNVFNLADLTATCSFSDVSKDAWYYMYIASAEKAGITTGRGDGTFGIGDDVTREEMATLIYRAAKNAGINIGRLSSVKVEYADASSIAPYALEAVMVLSENDIIGGVENGVYAPKAGASRAQAASAIYNIKKHIK